MARARGHRLRNCLALVAMLGLALPATALAAAFWGFGVGGQKTATITWQPDSQQQKVKAVAFTLPVNVKSAKTRLGTRCTVPKRHPRQANCPISPHASFGYVDLKAKKRIPCDATFHFSVKPVGSKHWVRQSDLRSANGCG
jgi:hypothetical protein